MSLRSRDSKSRHHPWDDEPTRLNINPRDTSMENGLGVELECYSQTSGIKSTLEKATILSAAASAPLDNDKQRAYQLLRQEGGAGFPTDKFIVDPKLAGGDEWNIILASNDPLQHHNDSSKGGSPWVDLPSNAFFPEAQQGKSPAYSNSFDMKLKHLSDDSTQPSTLPEEEPPSLARRKQEHGTKIGPEAIEVSVAQNRSLLGEAASRNTSLKPPTEEPLPPSDRDIAQRQQQLDLDSSDYGQNSRSRRSFFRPRLKRGNSKKQERPPQHTAKPTATSMEQTNESAIIADSRGRRQFSSKSPARQRSKSRDRSKSRERSMSLERIRNPKIAKKFSRFLKSYGNDTLVDN